MDAGQLTLKKTTRGGVTHGDDWLVMWRGLNVGRIFKQSGAIVGVPDMPGTMDGLKLAAAVRNRWPPAHIVIGSGMYSARSKSSAWTIL